MALGSVGAVAGLLGGSVGAVVGGATGYAAGEALISTKKKEKADRMKNLEVTFIDK